LNICWYFCKLIPCTLWTATNTSTEPGVSIFRMTVEYSTFLQNISSYTASCPKTPYFNIIIFHWCSTFKSQDTKFCRDQPRGLVVRVSDY
jgi:hypothetical protein